MNKLELEHDLQEYSLDELQAKYKLSRNKLVKLIQENGLTPLYERRTPVTKGFIPVEDKLAKYVGKAREKVNSELGTAWIEKERAIYNKQLTHVQANMGQWLARYENTVARLQEHKEQELCILNQLSILDYCNNDPVTILEESAFGNKPKCDKIDMADFVNGDDVVISYLIEKYGMSLGCAVLGLIQEHLKLDND